SRILLPGPVEGEHEFRSGSIRLRCPNTEESPMKSHTGDHHCHHAGSSNAADAKGSYDRVSEGYIGTVYTCPMHPQVRDIRNSGCPTCGMALEPETVVAGEEDTSELDDMTRRFWVSALLTLPLVVYVMGDMLPGRPL